MAGYGTDEGFATWAEAAGYDVPEGTVAAARQRGSVYVDGTYEDRWPGTPTGGVDQERSWPRTGATDRYGNVIDADTVPARVISASYEAALLELQSPGSLSIVGSNAGRVKRERVEGAVEVEYAASAGSDVVADNRVLSTVIDGILAPLLTRDMPAVLVV
ncbi:MAG TPA: DnaT-like ssDNA-binding protein [Pseudolabrys sp.]|nr:DnaT-like ssDNA-binding protein [Pseudolabrys sp.]